MTVAPEPDAPTVLSVDLVNRITRPRPCQLCGRELPKGSRAVQCRLRWPDGRKAYVYRHTMGESCDMPVPERLKPS